MHRRILASPRAVERRTVLPELPTFLCRIAGTSVRWNQLVIALASPPAAGAPIVNNAGEREGLYDFDVRWRPLTRGGGTGPDAPAGAQFPDSIITAVQEQLGLKLNPTEGAMQPMIVVTDARTPEPN